MGLKLRLTLSTLLGFVCAIYSQNWQTDYNKSWKVLSKKDSAFFYMETAKKIAKTNNSPKGIVDTNQGLMYISGYHYDLSKLESYLEKFKNDLQIIDDPELKAYGRSIFFLENINYNYKLGSYPIAQQYVDSLFGFIKDPTAVLEANTKLEFYDKAAKYQASIYKRQAQYEQARETYRRLLRYLKEHVGDENVLLKKQFSVNRLLSQTYASSGNLTKAIELEQQLLNDKRYAYLNDNASINLALNHIRHLIEAGRFEEARQRIKSRKKIKKLNAKFQIIDLENKAKLNFGLEKTEIALQQIDHAITVATSFRKNELHPDVLQLQLLKAHFLNESNKEEKAFYLYKTLFEKLEVDEDNLTFINKRLKIKILKGIFSNKHNILLSFKEVFEYGNSLIRNIDFLQPQFENATDKQALIENTFETVQYAFSLNANNYLKNKQPESINMAFKLSEKYRSIDLRQHFTIKENNIITEVDKSLLEKEKNWQARINYLQNAVLKKPSLKDELFDLNFNYTNLKTNFKRTAPKFYNAKYGNEVSTIADAQKHLKENQAFIDYFFGIDALYITLIKSNTLKLHKVDWHTDYDSLLNTVLKKVSTPNFRNNDNDPIEELSNKILAPISKELPERLIVIPDGGLHHLPFEILIHKNDFLLTNAAVSYTESISLFMQNKMTPKNDVVIEAFAPFTFDADTNSLTEGYASLNWARKEFVFPIKELHTTLHLGKEASLSQFRQSIQSANPSNLNMYHIASHAAVGTATSNDGFIVFNGEKTEKLYTQDVYGLPLNESFIILSACETGIGDVIKGQGMRSFSQAFRYAGAKSLLHTKWKVSDRFSSFIMNSFYEELARGKPKDIALQQAKLNYLKQAPDIQSRNAYYWAGYVLSGNLDAIPLKKNNYYAYIFLGIVFLMIFTYFLKSKK